MKIINSHSETVVCPPEEELEVIRHSAAHIMAQAIQRLWPEADFAFGPATDKGFYYDVDLGETKLTGRDQADGRRPAAHRRRDAEDRQGEPPVQVLHPAAR